MRLIVADAREERLVKARMVPEKDSNFIVVGAMCLIT